MALKLIGEHLTINILPETASMRQKRNGLDEGDCTFECCGNFVSAGATLLAAYPIGSLHPYLPHLYMESRQLVYTATSARMVCSYAGAQYVNLEKPVYELVIGMQEVEIEAHPNFKDFAGTPSSNPRVNGAIWIDPETGSISTDDATGLFDRFAPQLGNGDKNPKGGVNSFLDPVVTYRESYVAQSLPSASGFGRIVSNVPGPGFKGSLGARNWLYVGFTYRRRGSPEENSNRLLYEVQKEWKLSGVKGWDTDIYGT
jgi:hypothetical protein